MHPIWQKKLGDTITNKGNRYKIERDFTRQNGIKVREIVNVNDENDIHWFSIYPGEKKGEVI